MAGDETRRLRALHDYRILDSETEVAYDELTRLASLICGTPIAAFSLVDENRQWFKSVVGLGVRETEREVAFCHHAIQGRGTFVVEDATQDRRFNDNRLVTQEPGIRFYAGTPLVDAAGFALGTLCVIDTQPRCLTPSQREGLEMLGRQATALLAARRVNAELQVMSQRSDTQLRKTRALQTISNALIDQANIGDLQQKAVDLIAEALPAHRVTMFTIDVANRTVIDFRKGGTGVNDAVAVTFDELWDGLSGWVLRHGLPAFSPKSSVDPRESSQVQARRAATRCGDIIVVPIQCNGETLGTITAINDPDGVDFSANDTDLVMAMASQVAAAMTSHRLYRALRERTPALEAVTERMSLAIEASGMGVWEWDVDTQSLRWDDHMYDIYGRPRTGETEALTFWSRAVHPDDLPRIEAALERAFVEGSMLDEEFRIHRPNGEVRHVKVTARGRRDGHSRRMVGVNFDITQRKMVESVLEADARRDKLTGLANRAMFIDRLTGAVRRINDGQQAHYAVLFLDFDRFKVVNDTLGHQAGDELLRQIADRLRGTLRAADTIRQDNMGSVVSRFGGDEFLILINDLKRASDVLALVNRLLAALTPAYSIEGTDVRSSASIGVVTSEQFIGSAEEIVHKSDLAMYAAKRAGRARHALYHPSMQARIKKQA